MGTRLRMGLDLGIEWENSQGEPSASRRLGGIMSLLVEFRAQNSDTTVMVAALDSPGAVSDGTVYRGGLPRDLVERSSQTLDEAIARVKPAAQALVTAMTDLPRRPDELTVTFGIELSGSMGAIIASTAAKANIAITLTWRAAQAIPAGGEG
jgi:Trypsin-co-occurring domain 1